MKKTLLSSDETYLKLARPEEFQKFCRGLIEYLQNKLKRVEFEEGGYYYTCGQPHERYSQNWKSFPNLWAYTDKKGLDFYAVKDLLDEFFFRELECECEILGGHKEVRRRKLEEFSVYFGDPGRRDVDVI